MAIKIIEDGLSAKNKINRSIEILSIMAIFCLMLLLVGGCLGNAAKESKMQIIDSKQKDAKQAGFEAYKKGQWDQAIDQLKKAATDNPKDINTRFQLAQSYEGKNLNEDAIKQYEAVLALDKNNADAHYNIGRIYMERNEIDKAVTKLELAVKNNPNFASARVDLANVYTLKKDYERALATYDELAKTFKTDTKYMAHIHVQKGNIYKAMDDPVKAKMEYEAAVKLDKNNVDALGELSR